MTRSEESKIKKIVNIVLKLWNIDHLNIVVGYEDDRKFNWIAPRRTKTVLDDFALANRRFKTAYDADQQELANLDEFDYYDQETDGNLLKKTRTEGSPALLPFNIGDMTQSQLWKWVGKVGEMEQELHSGVKRRIRWGDDSFKVPGWDDNVWPWRSVKNPKNMKAADFPGTGGISEYLKSVARSYFQLRNMNSTDFINPSMRQEELRRKQTYRRNRPQETEDSNSENDDPAEPENDDPVDPVYVTDGDGQNNNSDISEPENLSNDNHNNISAVSRQSESSLESFGMATLPRAKELPSPLSPIRRPIPQIMHQSYLNTKQTRSMSRTLSRGSN